MAADTVVEPNGKRAGRVTFATTLVSIVPPVVAAIVVVVCFLLGIFDAGTAAGIVLAILATAGFTTGGVFVTGKNTPTDQHVTRVVAGEQPAVLPVDAPVDVSEVSGRHVADEPVTAGSTAVEDASGTAEGDLTRMVLPEPGSGL